MNDKPEQNVAMFEKPRLPYSRDAKEKFNLDQGRWMTLINTIFPAARSLDAIFDALEYCKAKGLDPFKRPVHIVPMWSSVKKAMVEVVWPGINELRTTAARTGEFAGFEAAQFGSDIKRTFKGKEGKTVEVEFPEWCSITVRRMVGPKGAQVPMEFPGPRVWWMETYAKEGRDVEAPNEMWRKRPRGQLEKCAEAAALRRAFPEQVGNDYAMEEMIGQDAGDWGRVIEWEVNKEAPPPKPTAPPVRSQPQQPRLQQQVITPPTKEAVKERVQEIMEHREPPPHDPETGEIAREPEGEPEEQQEIWQDEAEAEVLAPQDSRPLVDMMVKQLEDAKSVKDIEAWQIEHKEHVNVLSDAEWAEVRGVLHRRQRDMAPKPQGRSARL